MLKPKNMEYENIIRNEGLLKSLKQDTIAAK